MDADLKATTQPNIENLSVAAAPSAQDFILLKDLDFSVPRTHLLAQVPQGAAQATPTATPTRVTENAHALYYSLVAELSGKPVGEISGKRESGSTIVITNAPTTMPTAPDALLAQVGIRPTHKHRDERDRKRFNEVAVAFDNAAAEWSKELGVTPAITSLSSGIDALVKRREEYLRLNPSKRGDLDPHRGPPKW